MAPRTVVARACPGHTAGSLDRSLPVLLQRAERTREGRLHENSEWRTWHRTSAEPCVHGRRSPSTVLAQSFRATCGHRPRQAFWPFPAQRHHCDWFGCRPRCVRSESGGDNQRGDAPHAGRLFDVRRYTREGGAEERSVKREDDPGGRKICRQTGKRRIREAAEV